MMKASIACIFLLAATAQARVGEDNSGIRDLQVDPTKGNLPPYPKTVIAGDEGEPADAFPLGLCQGDCDGDDECAEGLVCLDRSNSDDPVPGCTVTKDADTTDFCVFPEVQLIAFQPEDAEDGDFPLGVCEGDCDGHSQCGEGLYCWQRNKGEPVPGCSGIENYEELVNRPSDFCVLDIYNGTESLYNMTIAPTRAPATRPPTTPGVSVDMEIPLDTVGNNGEPEDVFPLGRCLGDCDDDDECADDLVCFSADRGDEIPGCVGESDGTDFCVRPQDAAN